MKKATSRSIQWAVGLVCGMASLGAAHADPLLTGNAFDIVVERGEVYLMGMVTEREANRAAELVSTIQGVRKVVKVFQIISEDELARKLPRPAPVSNGNSTAP